MSRRPHGHLTHPKYRPDIDGLRAIAVIAVVGFHAFPRWMPGGFVGVDIFFVISGYLISTILFGSLERDRFSFAEFYSRRIRRIFPALLVVLAAVYAAGWFTLAAEEYQPLGDHLAGGAGFLSNFILWRESGYFDSATETKLLLHLWSLGIEEQYYLIWPLLLWTAWKRKFNLLAVTIGVALISFALNVIQTYRNPVAAFYSPQTRFWELLIGSALAYATLYTQRLAGAIQPAETVPDNTLPSSAPGPKENIMTGTRSIVGGILIGASLFLITRNRAFPGWWAVLPVFGSALIVSAGPKAWLNRVILSNRVLVSCGLISYPIYLWHWPLLAFPRVIEGHIPSDKVRISAVAISVVLAWITYKLVERPLRFSVNVKQTVTGLVVLLVLVGVAGYFTSRQHGLTSRTATIFQVRNDGDITHSFFHHYAAKHFYPCTPLSIRKDAMSFQDALRCLQSKPDGPIDVAIIGDSHAEELFPGFAEQFPEYNISYYVKTSVPLTSDPDFKTIFQYLLSDKNIKTVIIAAYWYPKQAMVPKGSNLKIELSATVEALGAAGKNVIITDDVPNFSFDPKQCKYSRLFSGPNNCIQESAFFNRQLHTYYPTLQCVAETHSNVKLLDTAKEFCDSRFCSMANAGQVLYRDNNHLNLNGTRYLARKVAEENPQLFPLKR